MQLCFRVVHGVDVPQQALRAVSCGHFHQEACGGCPASAHKVCRLHCCVVRVCRCSLMQPSDTELVLAACWPPELQALLVVPQ